MLVITNITRPGPIAPARIVRRLSSPLHSSNMASTTWQTKVAAKQQSSRDKIPKEWLLPSSITGMLQLPLAEHPNRLMKMNIARKSGLLSERELEITEKYNVEELLEQLRTGALSSLEVTIAFSKRAAMAQQLVRLNLVHDTNQATNTSL
jgi:hypothetical protein